MALIPADSCICCERARQTCGMELPALIVWKSRAFCFIRARCPIVLQQTQNRVPILCARILLLRAVRRTLLSVLCRPVFVCLWRNCRTASPCSRYYLPRQKPAIAADKRCLIVCLK